MEYAAVALALLGLAVGTLSRLSVLLAIVVALFLLSVGVAIYHHLDLFTAFLVIMAAQTIVQGSYFLGLVARALIAGRPPHPFQEGDRAGPEVPRSFTFKIR